MTFQLLMLLLYLLIALANLWHYFATGAIALELLEPLGRVR